MEQTQNKRERAILAGLAAASMDERERSSDVSMEELAALVEEVTKERVAAIAKSVECDLIYFLCAGDAEENAEEEEEADDAEA